jgi:hypothetical protein
MREHYVCRVPQCQHSYVFLREDIDRRADGTWTCPGPPWTPCTEGEIYDESVPEWCGAYFERSMRLVEQLSQRTRKNPASSHLVLFGVRPQTMHEGNHADRYCIYIASGSNDDQIRYQLGHEAVHRLNSPPHTRHWTHEMVAELFTIEMLRREGHGFYAHLIHLSSMSNHDVDFEPLCHAAHWDASVASYAAAYRLAVDLSNREEIGTAKLWELLGTNVDVEGVPDVGAWLAGLPENVRRDFAFMA